MAQWPVTLFLRSKLRISTAERKETSACYNTLPSRAPAPFYTAPKRRASGHRAIAEPLVAKLSAKYRQLTFCYEAGPTGYGLYRVIRKLGHDCIVAAPSLIPKKRGDRVKTNRRDAVGLAKLSRAGELTAVWVPDERHEAVRCRL
jgi:transposase